MSSTIVHPPGFPPIADEAAAAPLGEGSAGPGAGGDEKNPRLVALGERVRALRARRGMTRKALAAAADVSERHLANLEYGIGNASFLVLVQVAEALQCPVAELIGDVTTSSPEWLLLRELLERRDEATLRRVRIAVGELLGTGGTYGNGRVRSPRVALIGLRGAGKSTLGALLAEDLGCPFVELSREIEQFAGCSISEIQGLYGQNAYRRYERRALEEAIQIHPEAVIATPGGLVSDPATFNLLLTHCTTVWLQAAPEDHMRRVVLQGDMRPMAASREAMEDLKGILAGRTPFYSKADFQLDTSARPLPETFEALRRLVRDALGLPRDMHQTA
ncbi:helix-turn-helix transcriptional regulator [Piscinibacter sakaiensis]|uniref:Shikimate kinase n=1 Tax=Piscinibacter sakaiensis TaxID=1547922 RepID=A0A0K8P453_PISS1|nr:helix-turn-helix transcriptional regulator [Piscinibacter sakaiensis]GAP36965.1 regulatory protein of benzoate catabolism [Piscinibacter sakaiensis]